MRHEAQRQQIGKRKDRKGNQLDVGPDDHERERERREQKVVHSHGPAGTATTLLRQPLLCVDELESQASVTRILDGHAMTHSSHDSAAAFAVDLSPPLVVPVLVLRAPLTLPGEESDGGGHHEQKDE